MSRIQNDFSSDTERGDDALVEGRQVRSKGFCGIRVQNSLFGVPVYMFSIFYRRVGNQSTETYFAFPIIQHYFVPLSVPDIIYYC